MSKFEICVIIMFAVFIILSMYNTLRLEQSIKKFMITFMFYKEKENKEKQENDT